MSGTLTVSGNEITDARRLEGIGVPIVGHSYDGLSGDSSFGVWEASTNSCTNSNFSTNTTGWSLGGSVGTASLARRTTSGKFGSTCGVISTTGAGATNRGARFNIAYALSTSYTISVWYRAIQVGAGATPVMLAVYNSPQVNAQAVLSTALDGVWRRATFTFTTDATSQASSYAELRINGTTTSGNYEYEFGGVQIEAKSIATPNVHTDGSAQTRSAAMIQVPATVLNATQGWVATRLRLDYASTAIPNTLPRLFQWQDGGGVNYVRTMLDAATRQWRIERSGGANSAFSAAQTFSAGDFVTVIVAWTAAQVMVSINGAAFVTAANTGAPTGLPSTINFGDNVLGGGRTIDADFMWVACGTGTVDDTFASRVNAFGNTDKAPEDFDAASKPSLSAAATAATTMAWTADTTAYMDEAFLILDPDSTGASRGLLPRLKVEIDVTNDPTNATRVWTNLTANVRRARFTRSARNDELNRTETGSAELLLNNRGDAVTSLGSLRRRWLRGRGRWLNVEYARWQGLVEGAPRQWPHAGKDSIIQLRGSGQFKVFKLYDLEGRTFASQRSDQRFAAIAALVGLTTATVDTDSDTLDAISTPIAQGSDAWSTLSEIEGSDNGLLVEEPDGRVSWQGRHYRMLNKATSRATFGESAGQIPYKDDVTLEDDDTRLANEVSVTPNGGTPQTMGDATSQSKNFKSRLNRTILTSNASVALDAANYLLNKYKNPTTRIPILNVQLAAVAKQSPALVATLLGTGNSDRFTWRRNATTPIAEDIFIEGISETIDPTAFAWDLQFQASPADDESGWVLGDSVNGVLGTSTRLVY